MNSSLSAKQHEVLWLRSLLGCSCLFLLLLQSASGGVVNVHNPQETEVFVKAGDNAELVWDYTVDDKNDLDPIAFSWSVAVPRYSSTLKVVKEELRNGGKRDGADIPEWLIGRTEVKNKATLVITNVRVNDSSTYVFSAHPRVSARQDKAINLTVTEPPQGKIDRDSVVVNKGIQATFTCEITGAPTPAVRWTRWGQNDILTSTEVPVHGGVYSNLTVVGGDVENAGEYICSGSVPTGETSNTSAFLNIKYLEKQVNNLIISGTDRLCCPVSGYPRPNIQWIKPDSHTSNETCLTLDPKLDKGKYICHASNSYGTETVEIIFIAPKGNVTLEISDDNVVSWKGKSLNGSLYEVVAKEKGTDKIYLQTFGFKDSIKLYCGSLDRKPVGKEVTLDVEVNAWNPQSVNTIHRERVHLAECCAGRREATFLAYFVSLLAALYCAGFP